MKIIRTLTNGWDSPMSSYQHQYMMGTFGKDSAPDFLTCGHCAKEFSLENITLFISHKTVGCDRHSQSKPFPQNTVEDTSCPLTCSVCSRVFMTARGLLLHVQTDHNMKICLQKGPLMISEPVTRPPPPAHASVNEMEYTTTDSQTSCSTLVDTPRPSAAAKTKVYENNDQPTDLSMSCSNVLGKTTVTCGKEECKITIEPNIKTTDSIAYGTKTASALPKKRKFMFQQHETELQTTDVMFSTTNDSITGTCFNGDQEDKNNEDDNVFMESSIEHTGEGKKEKLSGSVCVKAEYKKESLCCVSLSTVRNEGEKHAKLIQLLKNEAPVPEAEKAQPTNVEKTTEVAYKFPFRVPPNPDSVKKKTSLDETNAKQGNFEGSESSSGISPDMVTKLSKSLKPKFMPGSTLEQNIDEIIRASISSDTYSEDFEILAMDPNAISAGSPNKDASRSALVSVNRNSPRLLTPTDRYNRFSQSSSDLGPQSLLNEDQPCSVFDSTNTIQHSGTSSSYTPIPTTTFGLPISVASLMSSGPIDCVQKMVPYPRKSHSLDLSTSASQLYDSPPSAPQLFHSVPTRSPFQDDHNNFSTERQYPVTLFHLDDNIQKTFQRRDKISPPGSNPRSAPPPLTTVNQESFSRAAAKQQWVDIQGEDYVNFSGSVKMCTGLQRSGTEQGDILGHHTVDHITMDTDDHKAFDARLGKKRRYPTSRPFKCAHCDQAFNQRIHLKKHMSKHTGVKPFKCQQCDYSTVERSHLKVHYRIHTGEKPYRCMYCDYATAQNSTLKIHLKRHHEGLSSTEGSVGSFHAHGLREDEDSILSEASYPYNVTTDMIGRASSRASSSLGMRLVNLPSVDEDFSQSGSSSDGGKTGESNGNASETRQESFASTQPRSQPLISTFAALNEVPQRNIDMQIHKPRPIKYDPVGHKNAPLAVPARVSSKDRADTDQSFQKIPATDVGDFLRPNVPENSKSAHQKADSGIGFSSGDFQSGTGQNLSHKFVNTGSNMSSVSNNEKGGNCSSNESLAKNQNSFSGQLHNNNHFSGAEGPKPMAKNTAENTIRLSDCKDNSLSHAPKMNDGAMTTTVQSKLEINKERKDTVLPTASHRVYDKEPTFVMSKPEGFVQSTDENDEVDEDDLDYSPALPSVNIPNKEYVRG